MRIAEQVGKHKPGMAAALADATVRDDILIRSDALALVKRAQFIGGLKGCVLAYRHRPGNISSARDVAAALRTFLGQICRSKQLAAIFARGAHIDGGEVAMPQRRHDLVAESADLGTGLLRPVRCARIGWNVGGNLTLIS